MAVVPVFVSSTFRDFHAERDVIRSVVAPALDALVAPLGARVELLDLRWGVDTSTAEDEQRAHEQVLDVCVAEIDRCRPLFVGLLGDRFGWTPQSGRLEEAAARSSQRTGLPQDCPSSLSVTGLEFWHGALAPDADAESVFAVRALGGEVPDGWVEQDPAAREGLQWLRGEVQGASARWPDRVRRFDYDARVVRAGGGAATVEPEDLDLFARALIDLLGPVVVEQARTVQSSELTPYDAAARLLAESRAVLVGREDLLAEIDTRLADPAAAGVVLTGPSGVGKTSVLLAAFDRARAADRTVASVLVGAGPGSTSTADVIGLLADQLGLTVPQAQTGVDQGASLTSPGEARPISGEELLVWWAGALAGLPAGTVIAVDGLDRLDPGDARDTVEVMRSLPPGGSRFLASTTGTRQTEALTVRGLQTVEVGPLAAADAAVAAREWARAEGARQLPGPVLQIMADRPRSGLWVRLAVAELSWLDATDYARAEAAAASGTDADRALTDLLVAEASELPAGDTELAERLLDRAADLIGDPAASGLVLGALALTRSGLAPADLQTLAGIPDALTLTRARWLLGGQLVARDDTGRLAFDHQAVRSAALHIAQQAGWDDPKIHAGIAQHLADAGGASDDLPEPDPTASLDRLWHALLSGDSGATAAALERTWASRFTLAEVASVIASAVVAGRGRPEVLGALAGLPKLEWSVSQGVPRQLASTEIEHGVSDLSLPERRILAQASLEIARRLAEADPGNAQAQRDWSASLNNIGEVAMARNQLDAAHDAYTRSLDIARRLAEADPGNAQAQRDWSVSLNNIGRVAMARNQLDAAHDAYTRSLDIARRLAEADPGNAQAQRDVSVSLWRLAELADREHGEGSVEARTAWQEVVTQFDGMRARGWIVPADEPAEAHARSRASGEPAGQSAQAMPPDSEPSLADLMVGAGDSTDPVDVARFWLATATWRDSFAVLRAGASLLATQAALDAVVQQSEGTERAVHATLLQMVAGGWPVDQLEQLVTDPHVALQLSVRAAANGDAETVSRVLQLNTALGDSAAGVAVLLIALVPNHPDQALQAAQGVSDNDPARALDAAGAVRNLEQFLGTPDRFTDILAILDPQ